MVFGQPIAESLVFSAASNFMTNTIGTSPAPGDSSFCFGLDAPVTHVPAGYSLETMVFLGTGINSAMKAFGTTMLHKYGTVRPTDYTREWLGFSTDNGAYYYYGWHQTEQYPNYQTAMEGVHAYSVQEGIPYKHILLDSCACSQPVRSVGIRFRDEFRSAPRDAVPWSGVVRQGGTRRAMQEGSKSGMRPTRRSRTVCRPS